MLKHVGSVALLGLPNAGKSTFLNALLKEKIAIISSNAQTTRCRVLGVYNSDEHQIAFLDLPGVHKPKFKLNQVMMKSVYAGLDEADLALVFVDISKDIKAGVNYIKNLTDKFDKQTVVVLSKIDLVSKNTIISCLQRLSELFPDTMLIPVSSETGDNLDHLIKEVGALLPKKAPVYDEGFQTDLSENFRISEEIRESCLEQTREELPHSLNVIIESIDEDDDGIDVSAIIIVEKVSQRKILLGKNGSKISTIRKKSQKKLASLLQKPVSLELFIKVKENWRSDDKLITGILGDNIR